jgi:hypothetical protein
VSPVPGPITHFDTTDYDIHFACELKEVRADDWIDRKQARRMDRSPSSRSRRRVWPRPTAAIAIADGLNVSGAAVDGHRRPVRVRELLSGPARARPDRTSPFAIVQIIPNMAGLLGLDGAGRAGTSSPPSARPARVEHGDRRRLDAIRLGARGRDVLRRD